MKKHIAIEIRNFLWIRMVEIIVHVNAICVCTVIETVLQ
jgi:hypothetical protein